MFGTIGLLLGLTFFSTTTTIQSTICSATLPATPVITAPAGGSTTSTQDTTVSGTANDNITINIFDNSVLVSSTTADGSGNFGVSAALTTGTNTIVAQAESACGQTTNSSSVTVTYTPPVVPLTPPVVVTVPEVVRVVESHQSGAVVTPTVTTPAAVVAANGLTLNLNSKNFSTSAASVFLSGSTAISANVEVVDNGNIVADILSDNSGHFSVRVPLSLGKNNIQFIATAGSTTITKNLVVTRTQTPQKAPAKHNLTTVLIYIAIFLAIADLVYLIILTIRYKINGRLNE